MNGSIFFKRIKQLHHLFIAYSIPCTCSPLLAALSKSLPARAFRYTGLWPQRWWVLLLASIIAYILIDDDLTMMMRLSTAGEREFTFVLRRLITQAFLD